MSEQPMIDGGDADAEVVPAVEADEEPAAPDAGDAADPAVTDDGDASLLALIDRLAAVLERSDLAELEVEAGGTGLVLRKVVAVAPGASAGPATAAVESGAAPAAVAAAADAGASSAGKPSVRAPLTGIFYASPAPGSPPYVQVGGELAVGQVIGLIEAMKLFNEIKSDLAGRVVRVVAESGQLVKAKQPLIEVEPL
jgi:acetyl-CoA carboxylase biotin carboxyl carrier protein